MIQLKGDENRNQQQSKYQVVKESNKMNTNHMRPATTGAVRYYPGSTKTR